MASNIDAIFDEVVGQGTPGAQSTVPEQPAPPVTAPAQTLSVEAVFDEVVGQRKPDAQDPNKVFFSLSDAAKNNPDEQARRAHIAEKLGTDPALLPPTPEAEGMLKRKEIQDLAPDLANNAPKTAKALLSGENSKAVKVEELISLKGLEMDDPSLDYLLKTIRAGGLQARAAVAKFGALLLSPFSTFSDEQAAQISKGDKTAFDKLRKLNRLETFSRELDAEGEAIMQGQSPEQKARFGSKEYFTTDPEKAAYLDPVKMLGDIFQSLPSTAIIAATWVLSRGAGVEARLAALADGATPEAANAAAIAATVKTAAGISSLAEGAITYGQNALGTAAEVERMTLQKLSTDPAYKRYLELGYDPTVVRTLLAGKAGELSGATAGLSTALIAGVGGKYLGRIIGEGGSLLPRMFKAGGTEAVTEGFQSPMETLAGNIAVKTYADKTQELTANLAESTVQGIVLGGITGSSVAGFAGRNHQADQAKANRDALERLAADAASNPLNERAPAVYRDFLNTLNEGTPIAEVFVDAGALREVFAQAAVSTRELEKAFPDVVAQLADETNAEGFVRISTADLLTKVKTPEILKSVLDNARIQTEGTMSMSFAESEVFFQTQKESFAEESKVATTAKEIRDQHAKDMKEIHQRITDELVATGRYDAKVAASNAVPIAAFYATNAAQFEKLTPKEMFEQYPYRAARGEQGQVPVGAFAQTDRFKKWFGESKVVDAEGKPLVVYHGTNAEFDTFRRAYAEGQGTGIYLTANREDAASFADGDKGRVMEVYVNITNPYNGYGVDYQAAEQTNAWINAISKDSDLKLDDVLNEGDNLDLRNEILRDLGFDGIVTDNSNGLTSEILAFNPTQIKSAIGNEGTFDPNNPNILKQENRAEFAPKDLMSTFYEGANLSSIIHESGHFYLEVLERLASRPDAPQKLKDDYNKIMDWFGVTPEQWAGMNLQERTPMHEQFAESQELWMLEGKSPTLEMQPVFSRFRAWMLSVYKSVEQFLQQNPAAGKLNAEVRAVFSRLIASEEAVRETEAIRGYVPLFQTAEQAGMTPDAFDAYIAEHEEGTRQAVDDVQKRSMRDLKWLSNARSAAMKKIQAQAERFRIAIKEEVTAQVMAEPINQARRALLSGEVKLNTAALEGMAEDPALKGMIAEDGLNPDLVAMQFGYPSGDALLYDLVKAENAQEKIDGITDQRMLEEHGEMIDARAIEEATNAAVVNDARTRFLASGLKILTKSGAPISQITKAAKLAAEERIAKIPLKDLRPAQYAAVERRSLLKAVENAGKDPAAAVKFQRAGILNNQLYKAAIAAQEEIQTETARLKRITKPAAQKAMGGEHLLQLNALLDRFGIRSKQTLLTETAPRTTLEEYAATEQRRGLTAYLGGEAERLSAVSVNVPEWIASEQVSQAYDSLTLEQFRELMDAVKAIEILARRDREQYQAIRGQTFEQEKVANLARLREVHPHLFLSNGRLKPQAVKQAATVGRTIDEKVDTLHADLYSFETIVNVLEGGVLGPLHESLTGRMSARQDWKLGRMEAIYKMVEPLFEQYSKLERRAFTRKDIGMKTLGFEMTREGAVMVALYHGSAEGRNRLENHGWNLATQQKIIDLLDPRDVKVVNGVWNLFDESLWPELKALDERTKGKAAPKVEAVSYTTRGGEMTGGYFKIKYDTAISTSPRSGEDAVNQLMGRTPGGRVTTAQGASIAREEDVGVNKRPRLDFNVFFETVNEIVNDLTYREAVADTQRMLLDPDMELAIKAASSEKEYNALKHRIGAVVMGSQEPTTFLERMSSAVRKNTVVVLMSGTYTALQNYLNFVSVGHRVDKGNLAVEILRMHGPTGPAAYRFATQSSEYLRLRHLSYDRSLQENSKKLTVDEPLMPQMSTWLWLMGMTDKIVSTTTWNAAYKEGMVKHANDTSQAVAYADHIVRQTLGSGRDFDISKMQEGALRQLLVMFYSFQNSQLQMQMRSATLAKREWKAGDKVKAMSMSLGALLSIVIMPAIFNDIALSLLRGDPPDDDEDLVARAAKAATLYQMSFIPGLRDVGAFYFREVAGMNSYGFKLSPIESTIVGVGKGAKAAVKIWDGEGDTKATGDAIMGLSYTLGLPGLLVKNAVVGAGAWVDDTAGPEAMLFGPPKELKH